jgi:hypothetical protein
MVPTLGAKLSASASRRSSGVRAATMDQRWLQSLAHGPPAGESSRASVDSNGVIGRRTHSKAICRVQVGQGPESPSLATSGFAAGCVLILKGLYASAQKCPRNGTQRVRNHGPSRKKGTQKFFFFWTSDAFGSPMLKRRVTGTFAPKTTSSLPGIAPA